jgi:hypothetical protein
MAAPVSLGDRLGIPTEAIPGHLSLISEPSVVTHVILLAVQATG